MQMTPQKMPTFAAASQLLLCRLCLPPSVTGLQNSLNMKRDTTSQGDGDGGGDSGGDDDGGDDDDGDDDGGGGVCNLTSFDQWRARG